MKTPRCFSFLRRGAACVIASAMAAIVAIAAESSTGAIAGRVQNLATGAYLEGASVLLDPTQRSTLTSRDGSFHFPALPAGDYRVSISYTGLDPQTIIVSVPAGQSVTREVSLTSQVYALDAFTVAGDREGNALAITQQRNANNVKNVISADAFGNIADQNLGNVLMRLPGMAEEILEGQVTSVAVRGINASLNAVTLDGTRGANGSTTGAISRGFVIDRIPADFVERIEVTKALTPDLDGDSIGGAINLRTKSPLDRKGRLLTYMGGGSWNLDRNTIKPIGSVSFSDTFGPEQKFGVLLTASYNKTHKPRDSVYQNWQQTTADNAYFWFDTVGEDRLEHERFGVGARVDYKLSATHRVFLNTMYSEYKDRLDRHWLTMAPTAAQVRPGWTDTVTETFNANANFVQLHRRRGVDTLNAMFGGEKRLTNGLIDYGANYSHSIGSEDTVAPTVQATGVGFRFDRSDTMCPTYVQTSGTDLYNRADHRFTAINFSLFDDEDTIRGAHINWRQKLPTTLSASLKTGVRWRGQERDRRQARPAHNYAGPDGVIGRNPATGINDDNVGQFADTAYQYRSAKGRYPAMPSIDHLKLVQYMRDHPTHFTDNVATSVANSLSANGRVTEDVYAAYIMGDLRFGRLDVTTGVRVEETQLTGRGVRQEITPAERSRRAAWVGPVTSDELRRRTIAEWSNVREDEGEYRNWLPSLHFKYNVTSNLQARASYSTGIGRPNFSNLLRTTTVDNENMRVTAANPDLRPQTTRNYDLALEYYFEPAGYVSVGVFQKQIKDFIYGDTGGKVPAGDDNGFNGDYVGYDLVQNINGGSGRVRGFELAYVQRFTWLPGVWKGLGVNANYTRIETRGTFSSTSGTQTGMEIPGFMPETFNASVSYALRQWEAQVSYTHRARNLRDFSANPLTRVYYYAKKNVDLNLKYKWHPRLTLFVDVINLFDDPIANAYIYTPKRVRYNQVFTPAIKAGISGRF